MASPPPFPEEQRSPLPVPYEDPWRRLATDLAALVAGGGLKARELWRRNGEGSLALPGFWPRSLAALFWPLLVALGLALLVALTQSLPAWWSTGPGAGRPGAVALDASGRRPDAAGGGRPAPTDAPAMPAPLAPVRGEGVGDGGDGATMATDPTIADTATGAGPDASASGMTGPGSALDAMPEPEADAATTAAAPSTAPPSLLAELVGVDPPAWVLGLEQRPAEGLLRLRLGAGYGQLSAADQTILAERWLARCRELGYERLELLDPADHLLARPARVGSGMILLDSVDRAP